jgi:DNA-directed RNA polymerase specialized sigma24 family protein
MENYLTASQFGECVVASRIVDKVTGYLIKRFRRVSPADAEDVAHESLLRAARKPEVFDTQQNIESYLYESANFGMISHIRKERARRETLRGIPYARSGHKDPSLHIDYEIDLERAIKASVRVPALRRAIWLVIIEGWEWGEVAPKGSERAQSTWYDYMKRGMNATRKEMRRKGYYRFGRKAVLAHQNAKASQTVCSSAG